MAHLSWFRLNVAAMVSLGTVFMVLRVFPPRFATLALTVAALAALTGCVTAPTYGTGKRADAQLVSDVSGIFSLKPNQNEAAIEYKPRPPIVAPPSTASLPAPQDSVVETAGIWPESPEERRTRLRNEATENQGNPFYRSPIVTDAAASSRSAEELTPEQRRERFNQAKAIQAGAYQGRRYLSDPPSNLKVPAETAVVGDLGEPESKKEARRKKLATKGQGFNLRNLWPW
jgi:hypothetical protein